VLVAPDLDKEIRVEADAPEYAKKEVLSMKCEASSLYLKIAKQDGKE